MGIEVNCYTCANATKEPWLPPCRLYKDYDYVERDLICDYYRSIDEEEKKMAMTRKELLDKACSIVNGARDKAYGSPEDSFRCIGQMWNAYLGRRLVTKLAPSDVAAMMSLLKIARISSGIYSEDSWIDLAGYAACGGECASYEQEDREDKEG